MKQDVGLHQEARHALPHFGAFESTKLASSGTDILGTTHHIQRWREDLELLRSASLLDIRYSVPWHRIEREPGQYDFSWFDKPMEYMYRTGMRPVLDLVHHVSFPDWLEEGFANPDFPELYERFVTAVAERYPWADAYTVFNEPLPTTLLCSHSGCWYPHHSSDEHFVRMSLNVARAICRACAAIQRVNPRAQFVHIETCETHRALDTRTEPWVEFANTRRFLMHDLILGAVNASHPAYSYLRQHGAADDELQWIADHPARIDVLGLDYYIHSEMEWRWNQERQEPSIVWPVSNPAGFARIALEYARRFRVPIMLGETNLRGTFGDRITWLKFMEEQCEHVAAQTDFRGFCWYPSIDSTDWCHLCREAAGTVDPQGIWGLDDQRWHRYASELSDCYTRLARGAARSQDLPAYVFSNGVARDLKGYRKLMSHWPVWSKQSKLHYAA